MAKRRIGYDSPLSVLFWTFLLEHRDRNKNHDSLLHRDNSEIGQVKIGRGLARLSEALSVYQGKRTFLDHCLFATCLIRC